MEKGKAIGSSHDASQEFLMSELRLLLMVTMKDMSSRRKWESGTDREPRKSLRCSKYNMGKAPLLRVRLEEVTLH